MKEENLKLKEQELHQREIELMERELIIAMMQQGHLPGAGIKPTPKKRKGKFRHKALGKKDNIISMPSGMINSLIIYICADLMFLFVGMLDFRHTLTVQPAGGDRKRLMSHSSVPVDTPPGSPAVGRLRAYVCTSLIFFRIWFFWLQTTLNIQHFYNCSVARWC